MLPGFRFLFAAILLSMSILIFGLGAAALLRAAHDEVASIPSRRTLPEPVFAHSEAPAATLAMLRVEPSIAEKAPEIAPAAVVAAPVERAPEAVPVPSVEIEKLAALKIDDSTPSETVRPEMPAAVEAAPVQSETPASASEIKIAAAEQAPPPAAIEAAPAAVESVIVPPAPENMRAATRIATLGSSAATVEEPTSARSSRVKPDRSEIRKQERAQRAKERRRIAARRARLAREAAAAQQQQSNPFAAQEPTTTTTTATRTR